MYNRKSVGPRMEPWGTPTLTGYSCEYPVLRNFDRNVNHTWCIILV